MLANEQGDLYWLDGGAEQIAFYPSADKFADTRPRVDPQSGAELPDTRVEWTDVTGRKVVAPVRHKPTDTHVQGPFQTNWGFSDWTADEAKKIILALPDDIQ